MKHMFVFITGIILVLASLPASSQTEENSTRTLSNLHNARYCEVIIVKRHFYKMHASVYNTISLNNCPQNLWNKLDQVAIKKQFDASLVKLNGPRYFMMDSLIASSTTIAAPITTIGGIQFKKRADLITNIWNGAVGDKFYTPNEVHRYTVWVYNPGTTIYELISPTGDVYVMQSYAQIVDPNLHIADLPNLGQRLKLPSGWKFQERTLDKTLELRANGIAYVLNDDLYNSYQKE